MKQQVAQAASEGSRNGRVRLQRNSLQGLRVPASPASIDRAVLRGTKLWPHVATSRRFSTRRAAGRANRSCRHMVAVTSRLQSGTCGSSLRSELLAGAVCKYCMQKIFAVNHSGFELDTNNTACILSYQEHSAIVTACMVTTFSSGPCFLGPRHGQEAAPERPALLDQQGVEGGVGRLQGQGAPAISQATLQLLRHSVHPV